MSFARFGLRTLRSLPQSQVARSTNLISQSRLLSTEARKLIDDAVHSNPLVLFMKGSPEAPQCGFSRAVCQILDVQGVPRENIKSYNCLEDQELREGIKEYSEWPTIPQVYVKGEFVGGCDILLSMHQSGELEELLIKEGLAPPIPEGPESNA
ncbi:Grx4 family monothiol glutaredoxin [Cryptococcus amylolentus CBS 6039]|uniref:Monothiol glutaredoxin-5, mitochondrial n=2 Tax=Cryptococcus amylolentus TaxID=104669 RepID=A0A1E3I4V4_9TREE|nr:Grx4 family monothiol glutaredoxin [Cryptococcus amylolentus CBS 6039]ODN83425.1 Grx4 family monothiol glutaredoxin [Cryptococcus amylolentus CBS 6039]ODO10952.1 Grx4 family monothiol glutaredoxin [Cryptococcus amylolentus CBS 6273]